MTARKKTISDQKVDETFTHLIMLSWPGITEDKQFARAVGFARAALSCRERVGLNPIS